MEFMKRVLHAILGLGVACSIASAQNPVTALVIENTAYRNHPLPKAQMDLAARLIDFGLLVHRHENLDSESLKQSFADFVRQIPPNGHALIYFRGYGAHVERSGVNNLLRPIGSAIRNEGEFRKLGLNLVEMTRTLRENSSARFVLFCLEVPPLAPLGPEDNKTYPGLKLPEFSAEDRVGLLVSPHADGRLSTALVEQLGNLTTSISSTAKAMQARIDNAWLAGNLPESGWGKPKGQLATDPTGAREAGDCFVNGHGMVFRWCPPGNFTMGSKEGATPATRDRAPVEVSLSQGFWMGAHEVTQHQYNLIRGRRPVPDEGFIGPNKPFYGVADAKGIADFLKQLNEKEKRAGFSLPEGWGYVCPTEAEWEYACRAGSTTRYHFGDDPALLGQFGNIADTSLYQQDAANYWACRETDDGIARGLASVGSYRPNAWGLFDMHGNLAELVADNWHATLPGGTDPLFRAEKDGMSVLRGGAWCSDPTYCESSFRNAKITRNKYNFVGFRIALKNLPPAKAEKTGKEK